jgi:hypothetical protein
MANILLEANHLSGAGARIRSFLSVWTPHRFGSIFSIPDRVLHERCQTRTGRAYVREFVKDFDFAESIGLEVVEARTASRGEARDEEALPEEAGAAGDGDRVRVRFRKNPSHAAEDWIRNNVITREEYFDLLELVTIFAEIYRFQARALNAFATCRTPASTFTAVDTEMVLWKDDVIRVFDEPWGPGSPIVKRRLEAARACVAEIGRKIEMHLAIAALATELKPQLQHLRLGGLVIDSVECASSESPELERRRRAQEALGDVTGLLVACLGLLGTYDAADARDTLKRCAERLRRSWQIQANAVKLQTIAGKKRAAALRSELQVIFDVFLREFERQYACAIPQPVVWYQRLEQEPFARVF